MPYVKGISLNVLSILIFLLACGSPVMAYRIAGDSAIVIYWTAPGDDSHSGRASNYDIRFSQEPPTLDTLGWWNSAPHIANVPPPSFAGQRDSIIINGLDFRKLYYFALRSRDEADNWSGVSNIAVFPDLSCADVNGDGSFNLADATYILAYYYDNGPAPMEGTGDVDNSGTINLIDATFLVKYLHAEGPPPLCPELEN